MAREIFVKNAAVTITRETSQFGSMYWDYTFEFATGQKQMQTVFRHVEEEFKLKQFAASALAAYELDREQNRKIISVGKAH